MTVAAKKDSDLHFHTPTLTKWFALASIALLVSVVWTVLDDHNRQWKKIQQGFIEYDVEKTKGEIDAARAELPQAEIGALENQIWDAQEDLADQREGRREAEAVLRSAEDRVYRLDQTWRNAKAYYATARYQFEQARLHAAPDLARTQEEYERLRAEVDRWVNELQEATAARDLAQEAVDSFSAEILEAEKQIASLEQGVSRLQTKLESIEPWWGTEYLLNEPLLDVMAPSLKIRQVVLDGLDQDMNYMSIPRVDRCMTCHMAIDKAGYEDAPPPYTNHPRLDLFVADGSPHPMGRFGCSTCHYGRDRSLDFARVTHIPANEEQEEEWTEEYGWHEPHLWDFPMLPSKYTGSTCFKCHMEQDRVPGSEPAREAEDFFATFGCYGCHVAEGYDGLRKVGPSLTNVATKIPDKDWTYRWIESPRGFRPKSRMPHFWNVENNSAQNDLPYNHAEMRGIVEYLYDASGTLSYEGLAGRGDAADGEVLVKTVGCMGCHVTGDDPDDQVLPRLDRRRFGPSFEGIGSKSTPEWIYNWIQSPKSYWPDTRMPDLRLTEREALDITAYLMTLRKDSFMRSPIPAPQIEARDEMLLEFFQAKMTKAEATERLGSMSDRERWVLTGERMIGTYGCFGCHDIPGFEDAKTVSIELSDEGSKSVHRFDFGHIHIPHTRHDWLATKIQNPRIFDRGKVKTRSEYQKMPDFGFTDGETEIGTTSLLSFVKDEIPKRMRKNLDPRETALEAGRRLTRDRNCRGCHELEGEGRAIFPVLARNFLAEGLNETDAVAQAEGYAPPPITVEGAKVEPDWLFHFLKDPSTIRGWLQVRMPTFDFTDEETNTLVSYFNALSEQVYPFKTYDDLRMTRHERTAAEQLVSRDYFNCFACHQQGEVAAITGPASQWAPNLSLANGRLQPDWIEDWMKDPQAIQPGTRMPTYFDPADYESSGPPDILGGDEDAQVRTIMKWVIDLGGPPPTSSTGAAARK